MSGSFFGQSSFSRYALTARRNAVVVDPSVDLALAASFGCGIQTGAGTVLNVLRPGADSSLLVFGLGGVGMAAVMAARNLGVRQIIGVDLAESRRATALDLGATAVVDGRDADLLDELRTLTGGGATHAFDTTGVPAVIRTAVKALGSGGTLAVVGTGADFTIDAQDLIGGGKTIRGSIEGDSDPQVMIPQLVDWLLAGSLPMDRVVSTFPFEDINAAVAAAEDGSAIKPVLRLAALCSGGPGSCASVAAGRARARQSRRGRPEPVSRSSPASRSGPSLSVMSAPAKNGSTPRSWSFSSLRRRCTSGSSAKPRSSGEVSSGTLVSLIPSPYPHPLRGFRCRSDLSSGRRLRERSPRQRKQREDR